MKKKYPIDLTGLKFGRLLVLSKDLSDKTKNSKWICVCECGVITHTYRPSLVMGRTLSCGCLKIKKLISRVKTHGKSNSRVYHIWTSMHARCNNPNNKSYHNYGGRGISVCDRWSIFENFYKDMGNPFPELSIERIDNSKGYSKSNCKWATRGEQMNNTRNNRVIKYNGDSLTLAQAAKKYKIDYCRLRKRLIDGWSVKDAIEKPIWATGAHTAKFITSGGETKSMRQWSVLLGGGLGLVRHRIESGWPPEKAISTKPHRRELK